ncbi:hypothetical protein CDFC105_33498 [Clostridioides difficile]|nr:hypothetical protein CDFC105_33498 [Clostridioides difficile]
MIGGIDGVIYEKEEGDGRSGIDVFFGEHGKHEDLHVRSRRQRQMCIRDRR